MIVLFTCVPAAVVSASVGTLIVAVGAVLSSNMAKRLKSAALPALSVTVKTALPVPRSAVAMVNVYEPEVPVVTGEEVLAVEAPIFVLSATDLIPVVLSVAFMTTVTAVSPLTSFVPDNVAPSTEVNVAVGETVSTPNDSQFPELVNVFVLPATSVTLK